MTDPFLQAVGALRAGQQADAERQFQRLLRDNPNHVGALNLLAQIRFKTGALDDAEALLRRAAAADPRQPDTQYNLGLVLGAKGAHEAASAAYRAALAIDSRHVNANANLAGALLRQSLAAQALQAADRALAIDPRHPIAHNNRGMALWQLGRAEEAIAALKSATDAAPDYAGAFRNLGQCLVNQGRAEDGIAALRRAVALDPGDREAADGLANAMQRLLPAWHFPMLADRKRNALYRRAIEAGVKPGMLVLDIGTGSGLLAMMAARAGAERVIACEADGRLAEVAGEIVARNGFADRITIVPRRSTDLRLGADLPRRAGLVLSEVLDAALLGEGVVATMRHALAELAAPGASIIPAGAWVFGALVSVPDLRSANPLRLIEGFDLSPFDRFRSRSNGLPVTLAAEHHRFLSEPVELFAFDFRRAVEPRRRRSVEFRASAEGTVHAMAMWYRLELDEQNSGSTGPGGEFKHWPTPLFFLERDVTARKGDGVVLDVAHDDTNWQVGLKIA